MQTSTVTRAHRLRAAMLAGAGVFLLGLVCLLAVRALGTTWAQAQGGTQGRDNLDAAVVLVALAAVVITSVWLVAILLACLRELLLRAEVAQTGDRPDPSRDLGVLSAATLRAVSLLLALTAVGSAASTGPASAASSGTTSTASTASTASTTDLATADPAPVDGGLPRADQSATGSPAPVPDFGTAPSTDRGEAGHDTNGETRCSAPVPGWSASNPRLQPSAATDQSGLLGSCGQHGGAPEPRGGGDVVVHRGDSLWSIVARQLGPDANAAQIAAAWPAWYAQNRAVVGPDPDILLPGTVLERPVQEVSP